MDEGQSTRPQPPSGEGHGHESDTKGPGERYEYTPLPDPEPAEPGQDPPLAPKTLWTRVLTIHPGEYNDDIAVDLNNIALEATAEPQHRGRDAKYRVVAPPHLEHYEALSYVWGSPENPSRVIVGEDGRSVPITRNLDVVMRHLRYPDRPRVVWVDSLCIDQTDPSDKSRQVGYMTHIYWSSPRVIVWLGLEADDSDHALRLIGSIGQKVRIGWGRAEINGVTEEDEAVWGGDRRLNELPLDERDWAAIKSLINRPWFKRVWIRQEVFLPGDEDTVHCGKSCVSLNAFRRGIFRVAMPMPSIEAKTAATVMRGTRLSLKNLIYIIKGAECTDPKDYVYATLGLLVEGGNLAISPDYSKPLAEIFQDVVMRYINGSGGLAVLETCGNDHVNSRRSSSLGNSKVPSWVPDWTSGLEVPFLLAVERQFDRIRARAEYLGNGVLRVAGCKQGVIQDFIEINPTTHLGFSAFLRGIVPKDAADTKYPGGGSLWDAYRIALCGNCFRDVAIPPQPAFLFFSDKDSRTALEAIIHGEELPQSLGSTPVWPDDSPQVRYKTWVEQLGITHRFFITDDGLIGWAPKQAKQGDHIVIMLGSDTPTVLRPVSSPEADQYEMIGPCYLQGFMHGEGVLGPLPDGVMPVLHYDRERLISYHKFFDTVSGETSPRDPRSDAFPDPNKSWVWTAPEARHLRVEDEDLRSRGVDVQYFDLV